MPKKIEVLQDMTTRRLTNLRVKATTNSLLGADNTDAIKSIDNELKKRVPVKKRSAKQQLADLAKSKDPQVRRRCNEIEKYCREAEERMVKQKKKQKLLTKEEEKQRKSFLKFVRDMPQAQGIDMEKITDDELEGKIKSKKKKRVKK